LCSQFVTVADLKKQKTAEKSKINDALKATPIKIDTHSKYLLGGGLNAAAEQAEIDGLTRLIAEKNAELSGLANGQGVASLRRELSDLRAARAKAMSDVEEASTALKSEIRSRLSKVEGEIAEIMMEFARINLRRESLNTAISALNKDKQRMMDKYFAIDASGFSGDTTCPTCGQDIPADRIDAARAKFNESKSAALEENVTEGKRIAADIKKKEQELSALDERCQQLQEDRKKPEELKKLWEAEFASVSIPLDFDETLITAKEIAIANFEASISGRTEALIDDIKTLTAQKSAHEQNLSALKNAQNAADEIEKLKAQEKDLSAQFEDCERIIALCDAFAKAKVDMLDAKISGAFRFTSWKLTETLVNGGTKEICDATINGVPYMAANNAAQINCGLDIIEAFSAAYNVSVPIFIDNAESVTQLYTTASLPDKPQVIQLIVSEQHKSLDLEVI